MYYVIQRSLHGEICCVPLLNVRLLYMNLFMKELVCRLVLNDLLAHTSYHCWLLLHVVFSNDKQTITKLGKVTNNEELPSDGFSASGLLFFIGRQYFRR